MQGGFGLETGPAAEPRAIDLQVLHDPLHVIPRLGERYLFDPIDRVDLGIARVAVTLDPFLDAAATGIVAGEGQDVGARGPTTPERLKGMVAIRLIDLDQGRRLI